MSEPKSLSRRGFLVAAGMGLAGAALSACGATPTPQVVEKIVEREVTTIVEGTPQVVVETVIVKNTVVVKETVAAPQQVTEIVEITYLDVDETGSGAEALKVYEETCKMYTEQHPNVTVHFQPGEGDWSSALIASMAAGNAVDVFLHWVDFGHNLMVSGQMLPLQEHVPAEDLQDFLEEQLLAMRIGPTLYALPKYASVPAIAYNKDLFDQAGVAYPDDSLDWEQYLEAVHKTANLGTSELGQLYGTHVIDWCLQGWVWQSGGEWMNKPVEGTKILIDEEEALRALKLNHDLRFKDHFAPTQAEIEGLDWWHVFQTGRFALVEVHSWMTNELVLLDKFNFDFVMLPKGPARRAGLVFNDARSVWSGTKHPDEAADFLQFISSAEIEKYMMLSVHGWLPSRKSVASAWDTESLGAQKGYNVSAFSKILPDCRQWPMFLDNEKVGEVFSPLWERIWVTGDLGLEDGVKEISSRVNEYLSTIA